MTKAVATFDPDRVWSAAGLDRDWVPAFMTTNGWTDDLLAEVIDLAQRAIAANTAVTREVAEADAAVRTEAVGRVLVNLADHLAFMPDIGWHVPRALPWLRVGASAPTGDAFWALWRASTKWGLRTKPIEEGETELGLVLAWQDVDPDLAPLAWAAGLTNVEALERQHAGTLTAAGLSTLAALRGYHLL